MKFESALAVECAVGSGKPPDGAAASGVIPAVLRAGNGVEIEVDSQTVLSSPFNAAEEVAP